MEPFNLFGSQIKDTVMNLKKKKWKESKSDTQKNKSTTKIKFQISDKEN